MTRELNYLKDVIQEMLERGQRVAAEYRQARESDTSEPREIEFLAGQTQGYYEALSLLLSELDSFGIPRQEVGVDSALSLEKELL